MMLRRPVQILHRVGTRRRGAYGLRSAHNGSGSGSDAPLRESAGRRSADGAYRSEPARPRRCRMRSQASQSRRQIGRRPPARGMPDRTPWLHRGRPSPPRILWRESCARNSRRKIFPYREPAQAKRRHLPPPAGLSITLLFCTQEPLCQIAFPNKESILWKRRSQTGVYMAEPVALSADDSEISAEPERLYLSLHRGRLSQTRRSARFLPQKFSENAKH